MFKNCGFVELLSWTFSFRESFPYHDVGTIKNLKRKALVDSISEVLAGIGAFTVFGFEKVAREEGYEGPMYNVTAVNATDGLYASFQSTRCMATCVGWSVDELEPPKTTEELRGRFEVSSR